MIFYYQNYQVRDRQIIDGTHGMIIVMDIIDTGWYIYANMLIKLITL